ncbi:MAG: glutamyl-tRNA reductase [Bacteroidota bacterium]
MKTVRSISLDGTQVPAPERERWVLTESEQEILYTWARSHGHGLVVLSTCYRFEIYTDAPQVTELLAVLRGLRPGGYEQVLEERVGEAASRHLLRVASGLESAVLGEAQILGQVRRARGAAEQSRTLPPILKALFNEAVATGRRIRQETELGLGVASAASAALLLARQAPSGLHGQRVVVVGGGEMGRLLLKLLASTDVASLTLVTAHASSVPDHVEVVAPEALPTVLRGADVVFAATRRIILNEAMAQALEDARDDQPLTVIDLGMPRNVAPSVGGLAGFHLRDIDALSDVVDKHVQRRRAAVPAAEALVEHGLATLTHKQQQLEQEAMISDLRRRAERIRQDTVAYVTGHCDHESCLCTRGEIREHAAPESPPAHCARANTDYLTRTLTNRLLHDLTRTLRHSHADLDPDTLRALFKSDA